MMFPFALLVALPFAAAATHAPTQTVAIEERAAGVFDVAVKPLTGIAGPVGVLTLTKTYHGDLDATSTGQMLGVGDPASGSAAYVAIEQVTGTLAGRRGSFALQHSGSMNGGRQDLSVVIAPGSGTGGLAGISGRLEIVIEGKVHRYVLRYSLPKA